VELHVFYGLQLNNAHTLFDKLIPL